MATRQSKCIGSQTSLECVSGDDGGIHSGVSKASLQGRRSKVYNLWPVARAGGLTSLEKGGSPIDPNTDSRP